MNEKHGGKGKAFGRAVGKKATAQCAHQNCEEGEKLHWKEEKKTPKTIKGSVSWNKGYSQNTAASPQFPRHKHSSKKTSGTGEPLGRSSVNSIKSNDKLEKRKSGK